MRIRPIIALALPVVLPIVLLSACAQEAEQRQTWNIAPVTTRDIVVSVQAAGIIEPVTTVELKSKASGEILEIAADTGDVVDAGTLLVQIDKRTPRNSLAQARAELEAAGARRDIAKTQRDRAKDLFGSRTINEVDYEQSILEHANAKAEVVRAEVAVENARIALDDTEVRAPIRGTIISRDVEVGQVISSPTQDVGGGTVLLTMADLRSVQVRALVDETDIGKILPGQKASVTVAAYPNQPFAGAVRKVEPKAEDEEAVTLFAVIVTIDNEGGLLKPGMNAEVEVDIASRFGVPAVPTIALRTPRDITAAAMYTGIEEDVLREQLRSGGMTVPDAWSGATGMADEAESADDESKDESQSETEPATSEPPTYSAPVDSEPLMDQGYLFGGEYWLLVMRNGEPYAQNVQTGLTDLDYSEIVAGLSSDDEVILLPSTDLIMTQDRFQRMMGQFSGLPGRKTDDEDDE
ncbi:MAG: efflux RND transporter periplasmic adaptor subunit [Gammaproteobacteria bacterium]|nr:efflux RND transporter periplasmic adaptor subunit [Gammaproteobacteria bacterium]